MILRGEPGIRTQLQGPESKPSRRRQGFRLFRITILLVVLVATATLNYWSREGDPRFFAFLNSSFGSTCARVFGWWRSPLEKPIPDKDDRQLTRQESNVKIALEHAIALRADLNDDPTPYTVRYRDIAFRQEFAADPIYLYPPYAIVSDLSGTEMDRTMNAIRLVHHDFLQTFRPLFRRAPNQELIHLLYFASRERYDRYQQQAARTMKNTSGFYSPTVNRLVLYYQDYAGAETLPTIRHEAAHQLFFTYGVHSDHRIENEWLIEGLASFCETDSIGAVDPNQATMLASALGRNHTIPIANLVNHRSDGGLLAYKPTELAYGQAWSLVHLLMQDPYRDAFFDYLRYLRQPDAFRNVRATPRIDILCEFLKVTPSDLQAEWEDHIHRLAEAIRNADSA